MSSSNREVLFNDGEGMVFGDFTNMQRFLRAMVLDQGIGASARLFPQDSGLPNVNSVGSYCLVPHAGSCLIKPDGAGRVITNRPGMIYQWVGSGAGGIPDGLQSNLLGYQVTFDELSSTFAANASGNPRIDALCIKLAYLDGDPTTRDFEDASSRAVTTTTFNKTRTVTLTKQVVQGTPGASPAFPTVPGGYVAIAYAYVPNAVTVFGEIHVWDNRLPMRVGTVRAFASSGFTTNSWTHEAHGFKFVCGAGVGQIPCPLGGDARIMQVKVYGKYDVGSNMSATLVAGPLGSATGPSSGAPSFGTYTLGTPPSVIATDTVFGNGSYGLSPVWGSGSSCGMSLLTNNSSQYLAVEFSNTSGTYPGDFITAVDWVYAY